MGGSLQLQEDVSSNPNLSFFCSYRLFILLPPSGACLSPSNQGIGKEGEEDPGLIHPPFQAKKKRKGEKFKSPLISQKGSKGDNYN